MLKITFTQAVKWVGTVASIVGAFAVASHLFLFGYVCFALGSTSWLYVGLHSKDKPLITLNGVFFVANILGLYNAIN